MLFWAKVEGYLCNEDYVLGSERFLKYYGLKHKQNVEDYLYHYAHMRAKVLSFLPGKRGKYWRQSYQVIFGDVYLGRDNNSLPSNGSFKLYSVVVADLIRREDIKQLQNGIRYLLKKRRSNRFLSIIHEGLDEICERIERMDASLLSWYDIVDCGLFEFKNHSLEKSIDYFSIRICNVNSGYLSLEFDIHLTQEKMEELGSLIDCNYNDKRGYAFPTLTGKRNGMGAYKNYTVMHYNNNLLKADKIYEFISYIEWEFLQELSSFFPFVLHNRKIMPPRIETYSTDIDYHGDNRAFWSSIGIDDYQGQFIDERHKVFFENRLSERYRKSYSSNRIIYIFKDDDIEMGHFLSIKDDVYYHLKEYAVEYFKFLFLDILSREAGKTLIIYKHKLDKIKLKKNHLKALLKLKYNLSIEIDDYSRYKRDNIWEHAKSKLSELYFNSDKMADKALKLFYISHSQFCDGPISESKKIDGDIDIVLMEFEEKKHILQNLADYKNTARSIWLNVIMMVIAAITLCFVIFPDKAKEVSDVIIKTYDVIKEKVSVIWHLFYDV